MKMGMKESGFDRTSPSLSRWSLVVMSKPGRRQERRQGNLGQCERQPLSCHQPFGGGGAPAELQRDGGQGQPITEPVIVTCDGQRDGEREKDHREPDRQLTVTHTRPIATGLVHIYLTYLSPFSQHLFVCPSPPFSLSLHLSTPFLSLCSSLPSSTPSPSAISFSPLLPSLSPPLHLSPLASDSNTSHEARGSDVATTG